MIDDDTLKNIENLHRLKGEGVITEEEFAKAKSELLNGPSRRKAAGQHTHTLLNNPTDLPDVNDHVAWMVLPYKRYADFAGRSTRREYWMFMLLLNAIFLLLGAVLMSEVVSTYEDEGPSPTAIFAMFGIVIVVLGSFVPLLAVEARRFQDQNLPAWLIALNLIPYLGALVVLVFMLLDGTRGANQFGPDPLGREPEPTE